MIDERNEPMIFQEKKFHPICAASFADNQHGINLFCKKLGYDSGSIVSRGEQLQANATMIGRCESHDTSLEDCSGSMKIGGGCESGDSYCCMKNQKRGMRVRCFGGGVEKKSHSCKGMLLSVFYSNMPKYVKYCLF